MLCIGTASRAQLSGTITVPSTTYPDLASVVTALNTQGVGTGGATVNITAANPQTAPTGGYQLGSATLNASLSATKPLVINGNANTVTGATGVGSLDAIFWLLGTDYVTINGLNLLDVSTTTTSTSTAANEWGFVLAKRNSSAPYDGCQYVTINNCSISLNKYVGTSTGILVAHLTPTNSAPSTASYTAADANSFNLFTGNTITNVSRGLFLSGAATAAATYDKANVVGGTTSASGNTITIGGTTLTNTLYGVVTQYDSVVTVQNNKIYFGAGQTGNGALYDYFCGIGVGTLNVLNNYFNISCGLTTGTIYGFYTSSGHSDAGCTHNINGNEITGNVSTATSSSLYAIYDYFANALNLNINNNYIHDIDYGTGANSTAAYMYLLYTYANSVQYLNESGNRIINVTRNGTSLGYCYAGYNYQYNNLSNAVFTIESNKYRNIKHGGYGIYAQYNYPNTSTPPKMIHRFNKYDSLDVSSGASQYPYIYNYLSYYMGDSTVVSYDTFSNWFGTTGPTYYAYFYTYNYMYYGQNASRFSNNLFENISSNAGYFYLYNYYFQNSDSNTIRNITLGTNGSTTGSIVNYLGMYGANGRCRNNTIYNITTNGQGITNALAYYGSYYQAANNLIRKMTINGSGSYYTYAGYYSTGFRGWNNRVDSITMGTGVCYPWYSYTNGANDTAYNNIITKLSVSTGTANSIYGMYLGHSTSGSAHIAYNNFISDIEVPSTFTGSNLYGIYTNAIGDYRLYNNTIRISPSAIFTGGNVGATGIYYSSSSGTLDLRNNIINVNVTPTGIGTVAALRRSSGTTGTSPANFLGSSNSNIYYTPNVTNSWLYAEGTSTSAVNTYSLTNDLAFNTPCGLFKSFIGHDQSSFTENNLTATTPTGTYIPTGTSYAEKGGTPTQAPPVTFDFAGVTRGNPSDIGALEFSGTAVDNAPPQIGYTPVATTSYCSSAPCINAIITDQTGVDTSASNRPRLYYKKSTETNAFGGGNTSTTNGWKYVTASPGITGNSYTFCMDYSLLTSSVGTGTTIQYFIIAQDVNANTGANIASFPVCATSVNLASANGPTNASPAINQFTILTTPTFAVNASPAAICGSGSSLVSVTPFPLGANIQWDSSLVGGTFGTIPGATSASYQTPLLTTSMRYRVNLYCGTSLLVTSSPVTVSVNNPLLLTTTGAAQCGYGTPTISATTNAGSSVNWYTSAASTSPVYTGTNFTVPPLSSSTTYYAAAVVPKGQTDKLTKPLPASYYSYFTWSGYGNEIRFSDTTDFYSTTVYAMGTGAGVVYVELYDSASGYSTPMYTAGPFATTGAGTTFNGKYILNLNWLNIPKGRYRMLLGSSSTAQLHYEYVSTVLYPIYSTPSGRSQFVGGWFYGSLYTGTGYYGGFYDNIMSAPCENSTRTAVPINVTPAPAASASSPNLPGICAGSCATINANSTNGAYTFTWTPATSLTCNNSSCSSATVCPSTTTSYRFLATDVLTGCKTVDSITIAVNPQQAAPTLSPTNPTICEKSVIQLTATPATPFGGTGTVGTGTVQPGGYGYPQVFGGYYAGHHEQYLIRASELTAAGIQAGAIKSVAFDLTATRPTSSPTAQNFVVRMAKTTLTAIGTTFANAGFTTVYGGIGTTYTPSGLLGYNNNIINFQTPFQWDGVSNIIFDVAEFTCSTCGTTTGAGCTTSTYTSATNQNSTTTTFNSVLYMYGYGDCSITSLSPSGSYLYGPYQTTSRPNMRFNWSKPYNINWTNVTGLYKTYPPLSNPLTLADTTSKVWASPVTTQVYQVYTNAVGCLSPLSAPDTVFVNPAPNVVVAPAGSQTLCAGQSVTLTVPTGGTYVYQWYMNNTPITVSGNTNSYTVTTAGTYKVAVTNLATGCADTSIPQSVIVNPLPSNTATAGGTTTFCNGGSVTLTSTSTSSPVSYQWYQNGTAIVGATGPTYLVTTSGSYYSVVTNVNQCTQQSNTVTVTVNTIPSTVTTNGPTTFCTGGSVTLSAPTTGTGTPYTYLWYFNGTPATGTNNTSTYTATASGNYYVVVSSASTSCSVTSATTTVNNSSAPSNAITPSGNQALCQGDTLTLCTNPSPGLTYTWYKNGVATGQTTACIAATTAGTYTVNVAITAQPTCNSTTSTASGTVISINPVPTVTITASGPLTFCQGDSVKFTAASTTANTYQWYVNGAAIPGATASTYTARTGGSYTARGTTTATGCKGTSNAISVNVNPLPVISATANGPTTFCQGGSVTITVTPTTLSSYVWKNANTNTTVATAVTTYTATTTGVYTVTATNATTGCSNTSVPVNVQVNPSPDSTTNVTDTNYVCQGATLQLKANTCTSTYTYQWRVGGSTIGGATGCNYTTGTAGTYTLRVTNNITGCAAISKPIYLLTTLPPTATATRAGTGPICAGDSVKLSANTATNYKYQWNYNGIPTGTKDTLSTYYAKLQGSYTVTVTGPGGCSTTSSPGIAITVNPAPAAYITYNTPLSFCKGSAVVLNANGGTSLTYVWYVNGVATGNTSTVLISDSTGIYSVKTTNSFGCSTLSDTLKVTANDPPVPTVIRIPGDTLVAGMQLYANYQWFFNNSAIGGATLPFYHFTQNGAYKVRVTDSNGCTGFSTLYFIMNVGVTPTATSAAIKVYPNPTTGLVKVESPVKVRLALRDVTGKIVLEASEVKSLDLTELANGMYLLYISDLDGKLLRADKVTKTAN